MSAFYKAISGLCMFVSLPILLHYLGNTNFGVWVLVFALFQWILLMDFGLSSVLKTIIPELKHAGNLKLMNSYVKSTYIICCYIALVIFVFFSIVILFFDVKSFFKIPFDSSFVIKFFLLNVFFFCINFVLNTHKALYVGIQKGKFAEQSIAVNQLVFLICLSIILNRFTSLQDESKLYLVSSINGIVCFIVNLCYSLILFRQEKFTFFNITKAPREELKKTYKLGIQFMLIQLGMMFLFSSDNYILAYFFGPKEIASFEIITKYFQFPLLILMAGMTPLWSLFSKHYLEKDVKWLRNCFRKFNYFYLLFLIGMLLFTLVANTMLKIWISEAFVTPYFLLITVAVLTSLRIFTNFYSNFFNGIGNLKSYLLLLGTSVILKIPLSYVFIQFDFGISSVVLSSIICMLLWCVFQPLQAYKIVSKINENE